MRFGGLNKTDNNLLEYSANIITTQSSHDFCNSTISILPRSQHNGINNISKIFTPKPFIASPSNIYNGLPWFLDYVHLSF